MQTRIRKNLIINTAQILVWVGVFIIPSLVTWTMTGHLEQALKVLGVTFRVLSPFLLLYGVNYYLLVPKFLHGKRPGWFYLVNAVLLLGLNLYRFIPRPGFEFPKEVVDRFGANGVWAIYVGGILIALFGQVLIILLAVGIRQIMRNNEIEVQMEEERRKTAEAELTWL